MFFDIIIIAMIAAFILLRLRSELGNKTGNEPSLGERSSLDERFKRSSGNMGAGRRSTAARRPEEEDFASDVIEGSVIDITANASVRRGLQDIRNNDRHFDTHGFLDGARQAYGLILEAFWKGDRETLENFVAPSVCQQFMAAIDAREAAGETVENRLLDIGQAEISSAQVVSDSAEIRVDFKADLISLTRDQAGNVIDGNMSDTVTANDRWTFSRPLSSKDPNWLLVATRTI